MTACTETRKDIWKFQS